MARGVPGNGPRGPNMKATLERHVTAEPSKFHYQNAAKGLRKVGLDIPALQIHRAKNVKDLAIWVDTVLWCGGDSHARTALLDRMLPKEARVIVDAQVSSRMSMVGNNVSRSESETYMEMLEADVKSRE